MYEIEEKMEDIINLLPIYSDRNDRKSEESDILYKFLIQRRFINSSFVRVKLRNEIHLKSINVHWKFNKKIKLLIDKSMHSNLTSIIQNFNESLAEMNNFSIFEEELNVGKQKYREIISYFKNKNDEDYREKLVLNLNDEDKFLIDSMQDYFLAKACITKICKTSDEFNLLKAFTINERFCDEITYVTNNTKRLLLTTKSSIFNHFNKLMNILADHIINGRSEIQSEGEKFTLLLEYLNGSYASLRSYQRLLLNSIEKIQMENELKRLNALDILARRRASLHNSEEIAPGSTVLLNVISRLLYQEDGTPRTVGIKYHNKWAMDVHKVQALLWLNMPLLNENYNLIRNNYNKTLQHCQWLMYEIQFVKDMQLDLSVKLSGKMTLNADIYYIDKWKDKIQHLIVFDKHSEYKYYQDNNIADKSVNLFYLNALITFLVGAIELHILTFISSIDPVEKYNLKRKYAREDHINIVSMLYSYDIMRHTLNYQKFGNEFYTNMKEKLNFLQAKESKYENEMALRPDQEDERRYLELIDFIKHFLKSNCDTTALDTLLELVENCYKLWIQYNQMKKKNQFNSTANNNYINKLLHTTNDAINNINRWLRNAEYFLKQNIIKTVKYHYQDIVLPVQCAVDNVRYGLTNFKNILQVFQSQYEHFQCIFAEEKYFGKSSGQPSIYNVIKNIIEFPSCNYLQIFTTGNATENNERNCSSIWENLLKGQENFHNLLYKAKLFEIQYRIRFEGEGSKVGVNTLQMYDDLFKIYHEIYEIWQKEEEQRLQLLNEKQSLYVQKVKCETEDESIKEQREINEIFPTSIETDFKDIIDKMNIEIDLSKQDDLKHFNNSVANNSKNSRQLNASNFICKPEDYLFLAQKFIEIFYNMGNDKKGINLNNDKHGEGNGNLSLMLNSFKYRLQAFMKFFKRHGAALNEDIDLSSYNALLLCVGLVRNQNYQQYCDEPIKEHYNVYKKNNITEIEKCVECLAMMRRYIVEDLLSQFPEHSTLQEILLTIEKIRHLPNNAPVVRYNIGLQILRQKIAQWNEIAHKHIALSKEEAEIAAYIQKWTSMELQCWRNCLDQIYEKTENVCYRYWFYIYDLITEFIQGNTSPKDSNCRVKDEIIKLLRIFMESSNYADFHLRLKLLKSFEHYLDCSEKRTTVLKEHAKESNYKSNLLISILYNLYMYYKQFEEAVQLEERKVIRLPIEKNLKEFIKIESYNKDISYIGMRNNITRIHRKLNKFLREYEKLLQQPIATKIFQYKNNDGIIGMNVKANCFFTSNIGLKRMNKLFNQMNNYQVFVNINLEQNGDGLKDWANILKTIDGKFDLLQRIDKLQQQSSSVIENILVNLKYPRLNKELNEIIYGQKQHFEDLRVLTVDRSKPRSKQITQAKQILQQKRKGLNDFFKILSTIGINYKTGLLEINVKEQIEDYTINRLINLENVLQELPGNFGNLVTLESLNNAYAKCIFKVKVLTNKLLMPRKELGPAFIDRLKGNAIEMFSIVQEQRQKLAGSVDDLHKYRKCLQQVEDLRILYEKYYIDKNVDKQNLQDNCNTFNYVNLIELRTILKSGFCKIHYVFEQFELLLKNALIQCGSESLNFDIHQVILWEEKIDKMEGGDQRLSKEAEFYKLMNEGMKHIQCSQLTPFCNRIKELTNSALNEIIALERKHFLDFQVIQLLIEKYQKVIGDIEEIVQILTLKNFIVNGSHYSNYREHIQKHSNVGNTTKMPNENTLFDYLPLAEPLVKLLEQQKQDSKKIFSFRQNALGTDNTLINEQTKDNQSNGNENTARQHNSLEIYNVLKTILISLQKLHKKYAYTTNTNDTAAEKFHENADKIDIEKNYLKATLTNEWSIDWTSLNLSNLMGKLLTILKSLKNCTSYSTTNHHELSILLKLKPFFDNIFAVMKFYFMQLLITHCLSIKLLSKMLNVFNEISEKGFCIPEDLLNDIEEQEIGPGPSKQHQQQESKFGLEDGEGEKDASDKIESEDQLDEAKLPKDKDDNENGEGKEKQKCKEDDGIEMSEDFDGAIQNLEQDGNGESDNEKDIDKELDKEMDHTDEGAEKLDEQLWGDDKYQGEDEDNLDEENEQEMEKSNGKGTTDERDTHNDLNDDNELATNNEQDKNQTDDDNLDAINKSNCNQRKSQPDIDQMKNPTEDGDEEQTNAYHNELEDPPEAEEMDLGDMRATDDDVPNEQENFNDENMFDIDKMKEEQQLNENEFDDIEMQEADEEDSKDNKNEDDNVSDSDNQDYYNINNSGDKSQEENDETEINENKEGDKNDVHQIFDDTENKDKEIEEKIDQKRSDKQSNKEERKAEAVPKVGSEASKEQQDPETILTNNDYIKQDDQLDEQNTGEETTGHGQATSEVLLHLVF